MKVKILFITLLISLSSFCQIIKVKHLAYEITFDTKIKEPLYTHYILKKSMLHGKIKRASFTKDPLIQNELQASDSDYEGFYKIYDKGHLTPYDDMCLKVSLSKESMYISNTAPEASSLNRGIWLNIEDYVRVLAESYDIEVWTGCIYENSTEKAGSLIVPTFYWKLIKYDNKYEAFKAQNIPPKLKNINDYKVNEQELLKLIK